MKFNNADYVHLHNHSCYSRFDGLAHVIDLVLAARKMGFKSLALTDHGNVGGWMKFADACRLKKDKNDKELVGLDGKPLAPMKPIFGCEFYLARNHTARKKDEQPDGRKGNRHLLLIAKNAEGYRNLCALSQKSFVDGQLYDPRIDLNLLAQHSKGLICQSACLSSVINNNLLHGRYDQAKIMATLFKDIFGKDFFLEVMYHGIDAEAQIIPLILKLAKELDIPVVCTNDCHYVRKEQSSSHEVLMAMSTSRCLRDPKHLHFPYNEFYLKSAEEMGKIFGSHPELIYNTVSVAERVEEFIKSSGAPGEDFIKTGGMRLPEFDLDVAKVDILSDFLKNGADRCPELADMIGDREKLLEYVKQHHGNLKLDFVPKGKTPYEFLVELSWQGLKRLGWDKSDAHCKTLQMELDDVKIAIDNNDMDFATYFLIVWDYINFARSKGILTGCGRGSGYASIILRCLRITYGPDPLKYGLIWERFLGFDWKYILLDSDWGFGEAKIEIVADTSTFEERETEDDMGGVDRY